MRIIPAAVLIAALAAGAGCAARTVPPPPAPTPASDAVRVARIVRLMELNRNRVSLEVERAGLAERLGPNHPQMRAIAGQLAAIDAAIAREFLPEEQAAVAAFEDRAMELRLQLEQEVAMGRGENHPAVVAVKRKLATVEQMALETREAQSEAVLIARVRQEPSAAEPQIELALHYLRAGRHAEAAQALDRALRLLRRKQF
ncbi:MAG TPA: hypothetical protein VFZ36_14155 [Vicinamibacterales bacterium]